MLSHSDIHHGCLGGCGGLEIRTLEITTVKSSLNLSREAVQSVHFTLFHKYNKFLLNYDEYAINISILCYLKSHQPLKMRSCPKQNVIICPHQYFHMALNFKKQERTFFFFFLQIIVILWLSFYCFLHHVFVIPFKIYAEQYNRTCLCDWLIITDY